MKFLRCKSRELGVIWDGCKYLQELSMIDSIDKSDTLYY